MANKSSKRIRIELRKTQKSKGTELALTVPNSGFHPQTKVRRIPVAERGKDGVVSVNKKRNTQMKVLHNSDGAKVASLTTHETIDKSSPMRFKNHGYMLKDERDNNNYVQPKYIRVN